jgi:hypothetical protein
MKTAETCPMWGSDPGDVATALREVIAEELGRPRQSVALDAYGASPPSVDCTRLTQ